ncbi:MAG: helix-turn-helix transcriptional regulator [Richelia sp. SM1_7_0]|nr:helix-turn-helix transcriptional regulator [Richelia sp. SM1_7_0]
MLTPTEYRVLYQASLGKSNKEIGTRLGMKSRTVASHLNHAYNKLSCYGLKVKSRRDLPRIFLSEDNAVVLTRKLYKYAKQVPIRWPQPFYRR